MIRHRQKDGPFRPLDWRTQLLVGLVVAVVTFASTASQVGAAYPPRWTQTVASARSSTILIGPFVAVVGAWVGGLRHTAAIGPLATIGWPAIARAQLVPLMRSIGVGHLVGLVPLVSIAVRRATGGGPAAVGHLSVVAGFGALLALGYLLGVVWSNRLALLAAALGALAILVAPLYLGLAFSGNLDQGTTGTSFYGISWLWLDFPIEPGYRETVSAGLLRFVWFSAVVGAAVLASIVVSERAHERSALLVGAAFIVPLSIGVVVVGSQPALKEASSDPEVCQAVIGSTVCVPADVEHQLPYVAAGVDRIVSVAGYGPLEPERQTGRPISEWYHIGLDLDEPTTTTTIVAQNLLWGVAGSSACTRILFESETDIQESLRPSIEMAEGLAAALQSHVQLPLDDNDYLAMLAVPAPLAGLTAPQLREFIERNADSLATCTASPALLDTIGTR